MSIGVKLRLVGFGCTCKNQAQKSSNKYDRQLWMIADDMGEMDYKQKCQLQHNPSVA